MKKEIKEPIIPYIPPKNYFMLIRTRQQILKVFPIPYVFVMGDLKKFKKLLQ